MPRSLNARRIADRLSKDGDGVHAQLVEWYETYKEQFEDWELEEIRAALWPRKADVPIPERPFHTLVPDGWFKEVLDFVRPGSEAPQVFFFLSSLVVAGHLVGRKVMIDRGSHTLGIEPSVLLISPAGRARRSTACDFVVYDLGEPVGAEIIADSFTYEAFGDALRDVQQERGEAKALVYAGEMSVLLGKFSYAESIIPKLTDLITKTRPFHWKTVKRKKVTFEKPCVNALMTTAPDWLVDNIPAIVFGGGMMSRLLVCVQERFEKAVTWGEAMSQTKLTELRRGLRIMSQKKGNFQRPQGAAWSWYNDWYHANVRRIDQGDVPDERMVPYFSRKHDHLLRIAGLLTLAGDGGYEFKRPMLEAAHDILEWLEAGIPKAYASMALTPMGAAQSRIIDVLSKAKKMSHHELHRAVYRHVPMSSQFKELMQALVDMDVVVASRGMTKGSKVYVLKRELGS